MRESGPDPNLVTDDLTVDCLVDLRDLVDYPAVEDLRSDPRDPSDRDLVHSFGPVGKIDEVRDVVGHEMLCTPLLRSKPVRQREAAELCKESPAFRATAPKPRSATSKLKTRTRKTTKAAAMPWMRPPRRHLIRDPRTRARPQTVRENDR